MSGDYHPWIVELYDDDNPAGRDHRYYRGLADRLGALSIIDLGCGTGLLTRTLARKDRQVVGIDPSQTMIDAARRSDPVRSVTWIVGDSSAIDMHDVDLVVMTGNVAQHIPDPDWERTLSDLHRAMRPGAVLAFESRNPAAQAWLDWHQSEPSRRSTAHGVLEEWSEVVDRGSGIIEASFFNRFVEMNELIVEHETFVFRTQSAITDQLDRAGFAVDAVHGDWQRTPFDGTQGLFVIEARAL
ncbi:class I SAM-dependent methyltransferase [Brevibacterium casei]|uniref:class I SAM-dependent methyltransferase n=1 Tax=Brevibacterium TaxID=1696 RepID=UPI0031594797